MSRDPLLVRALLATHPALWRKRYGDEYAALLCDALVSVPWVRRPAIVGNALRGAFDARLRNLGGARMSRRSPVSVAIWATGLFTIAGIGFQKLSEDNGVVGTADQNPVIAWAFDVLVVSAAVALAAMVVTALPATVAMARGGSRSTLILLAVPPLAFAAWYGILRIAFLIARNHSVHSTQNILAAALVFASGVGVVAATAWAASTVLRRIPAATARLRAATLAVLTVGMGLCTIACLIWGLAIDAADPAGFAAHDGILATPFVPSWIVTVVLMAAATAMSASANLRVRATPTT